VFAVNRNEPTDVGCAVWAGLLYGLFDIRSDLSVRLEEERSMVKILVL
jgi:hypothetical protein